MTDLQLDRDPENLHHAVTVHFVRCDHSWPVISEKYILKYFHMKQPLSGISFQPPQQKKKEGTDGTRWAKLITVVTEQWALRIHETSLWFLMFEIFRNKDTNKNPQGF